jgi:hypothetical protein
MQSYVSKRLRENVHYLSSMCINKRVIKGYDIPDNHEKSVILKPKERERERERERKQGNN